LREKRRNAGRALRKINYRKNPKKGRGSRKEHGGGKKNLAKKDSAGRFLQRRDAVGLLLGKGSRLKGKRERKKTCPVQSEFSSVTPTHAPPKMHHKKKQKKDPQKKKTKKPHNNKTDILGGIRKASI